MTGAAAMGPDPERDRMLTAVTGDGRDPALLDTTDVRDAIDLLRHVITSIMLGLDVLHDAMKTLESMSHSLDLMPPGGFADVPSMLSTFACGMEDRRQDTQPWSRRPARPVIPGATLRITIGYITSMPRLDAGPYPVLVEAMALADSRGLTYLDRGTIADAISMGAGRMLNPKADPETILSLSSCPLGERLMDTNVTIDKAHAAAMAATASDPATPPCGTGRARLCAKMMTRTMRDTGIECIQISGDWCDWCHTGVDMDTPRARRTMERRAASNVRADVCADIFRVLDWLYGPDMRRVFHDLDVNGQRGVPWLHDVEGGGGLERWLAEDMGCPAPFAAEDALARGIVMLKDK